VTGGALFDVALRFEGMVIGAPAGKSGFCPSRRMVVAGATKLASLIVIGNPHATVASLAKRLNTMTATTVGAIAPCFYWMKAHVVAGVKVHRLAHTVMTVRAVVLLMAGGAEPLIVLSCIFVIGSKLHVVGGASEAATGNELARSWEIALDDASGGREVTGDTSVAGLLPVVAA